MQSIWRLLLFVYNLLLIIVAGMAVAASIGRPEPVAYIELALSTPQNRIIVGLVGVILLVVGVLVFLSTIKLEPRAKSVEVERSLAGEVSITVPAIKIIIMKAVKKIEGIKEIRPVVTNGADGLQVYLHMMINPDISVPELSKKVQDVVREYLENIGGLKVAEVKVLVDDLNPGAKTSNG
ncbi:alkaline shock response membrane anchor protein AmaP [Syntrophomonas curvata]